MYAFANDIKSRSNSFEIIWAAARNLSIKRFKEIIAKILMPVGTVLTIFLSIYTLHRVIVLSDSAHAAHPRRVAYIRDVSSVINTFIVYALRARNFVREIGVINDNIY